MDYPFFFYQPWPFFMALAGFVIACAGAASSLIAWRAVKRMAQLLKDQESRHRAEIERLTK